ncbi:MAG: hypothetical protein M1816_003956 [Peltula sp. TS41687]|nr:MAG: hypothetical protein M1816_003956 [Peltula sp. TS41687]
MSSLHSTKPTSPMGLLHAINPWRWNPQRILHRGLFCFTLGIAIAALYRYCWIDARDPFKCDALLNHGRWLDPSNGPYLGRPLQNWQPPGCMLHNYQANSVISCLDSRKVVFIGDSTIRQVFWATAKKLNREKAEVEMKKAEEHSDIEFSQEGAKIDFIWDPFLNSSKLRDELMAYKEEGLGSTFQTGQHRESASLILLGGGLWYARYFPVNSLKQFKIAIDEIVQFMSSASTLASITGGSKPFLKKVGSSNFLLLAPIQRPWYESLSPLRSETITRDKVETMNEYLQQLSAFQDVDVIWSYSLMTYGQPDAYDETGVHVVDRVAAKKADILLNLRCNAETTRKGNQRYPFNKTCCSNYRYSGWVQWVILCAGFLVLPGLYLTRFQGWANVSRGAKSIRYRNSELRHQRGHFSLSTKLLHALTVFTLSLCYCFYADRTQVFNKLHKQYSSREFTSLCLLTLILGILSVRRSAGTAPRNQKSNWAQSQQQDQPFLSRDQTDEWKGWMQFIILIYHYTGASKVLWIYEIIRLLVASYLFMTGFGHTVFFLKKKDYSVRRVAAVLVRLNLLSCALPYMMRTDYLFYYFAPLVTLWFFVIYFTFKVGQPYNKSLAFLLMKILLSAVLITSVIKIHGILELIFAVLRYTCRIHWDVKEWRFRVFLDMFIVYAGMVCGVLFVRFGSSGVIGGMTAYVGGYRISLRAIIIFSSIVIIPTHITLAGRFPTKFVYNRWQPYISPLPILAFVVLRNSHRQLRNFYSSIFAWLGRCSLETFVLQFHIWLAADTKGLLSIGILDLRGREKWIEFGVLTAAFFWISWCVAGATSVITDWIVAGGEKSTAMDDRSTDVVNNEGSMEIIGTGTTANKNLLVDDDIRLRPFGGISSGITRIGNPWRKDLRVRIGMMLFVIWVLNMTYT